ncbi:clostripain-related cysteine peptidase [Verrucomicrobia bacterium]|nr:clostripain-related cysteine peptidase [Verrucomicrobiota bacterium]
MQTPSIDISGAVAHTLILKYDSSWRKEPHTGSVTVSYDGGPEIELLSLDGNSPDGFNETVQLELKNPDGAQSLVVKWDYQGHNNWWWAIDNVTVANVGNKPKKWTILAYTQGDNNLAYFIGLQNKILEKIGSSKDVNIVIQTDYDMSRREELVNHLGEMDNDIGGLIHGTTRIVIGENPDGQWVKNTQIEERFLEGSKHENRMDDPEFFGEFLDWGMANYPAERYGLFFLDHGGSWYGFGADHQDGLGGGNAIKPRAFRREIQSSLEKAGSEKFDFINFYACLMGATEVLDAFDGLCDVFYANPEICYLWRWNHEIRAKFIGHLSNNPNIDNISLAQYEVANWMPPDGLEYEAKIGVHCAYDMSKYTAFKVAFKKFSEDLLAEAQARNPIILAARRNTTPYWLKSIQDLKNQTEFMDLAHFAEILSKSTTGDLKISSTVLTDAIQSLIINKFVGSKRPDVSGLSIHYPVKGYEKGWKHSYDKTYFISSKTSDMDNWSEVPDPAAATGTGAIWSNFLREVNAMNGSTGSQTQFVLNNDGELVSSRSAEFGMAGSGVMTASTKRAVPIEFELESAEGLYDYFINLVSNRETDDPNQFIYLGELHRGLIKGNKKHQYYWDAKLPVLSLGGGGTKAPPVAPGEVDRKELIGEMPLYLGGWWSELSDDLMVSYADYQGPGEEDKTHLILMTKYLEGGVGILESTILDSSYEDALLDGDGENENKVAPVGVDFEFEPGGKLWPVYYMEEPDSENPGEWKPYFTWFKDGYIKIPGNGKDGLMIAWLSVEPGDYRAEVQVGDYFGNLSEELKFDIRVEDPFPGVPALQFSLEEAGGDVRFVLSWPLEMGGNEAILQRTDGIGREWSDVPSRDLGFGGAGRLYKESRTGEARFFRLIKR